MMRAGGGGGLCTHSPSTRTSNWSNECQPPGAVHPVLQSRGPSLCLLKSVPRLLQRHCLSHPRPADPAQPGPCTASKKPPGTETTGPAGPAQLRDATWGWTCPRSPGPWQRRVGLGLAWGPSRGPGQLLAPQCPEQQASGCHSQGNGILISAWPLMSSQAPWAALGVLSPPPPALGPSSAANIWLFRGWERPPSPSVLPCERRQSQDPAPHPNVQHIPHPGGQWPEPQGQGRPRPRPLPPSGLQGRFWLWRRDWR